MMHRSVFSEDFSHFEQNHEFFPIEAQSVFSQMSELRAALGAFRLATENTCVVNDPVAVEGVLAEEAPTVGPSDKPLEESTASVPSETPPEASSSTASDTPPDAAVEAILISSSPVNADEGGFSDAQ